MNFKKLSFFVLLITAMNFLAGCNTVEGFGKDVKHVGQSMESAAAKKTGN
ncbi:entericidin A [Oxalobacteraceae bacterium GrIS 2.11]